MENTLCGLTRRQVDEMTKHTFFLCQAFEASPWFAKEQVDKIAHCQNDVALVSCC